jgi:hypothetical protein
VRPRRSVLVGFFLAVVAVVGVTLYLHRPPDWIESTQRATLSVSGGRVDPPTITAHGRWWDPPCPANVSWKDGSQHAGRLRFDSATRATFVADDGTTLRFVARTSPFTFGCEVIDGAN